MREQNPLFNPQQNVSVPGTNDVYPQPRAVGYRGLIPARRVEPATYMAIAGLILGIISIVAWFLPVVGLPVSVAGVTLSALGRHSSRRTFAITGLLLAIFGLLLALFNVTLGSSLYDYLQQLS